MSSPRLVRAMSIAALAGLAAGAQAQITGIFCNDPLKANSAVPTIGSTFALGSTSSSAFDRPFLSPDGMRWIIGCIQEFAGDDKDIVVVGGGLSGAGAATVAVEDSATSFDPLRLYSAIDQQMGINNAGRYVFTADLDGATTDDEVLVLFDGVMQVPAIREGMPSAIAGELIGSTIDSAHIVGAGAPRFRASLSPSTSKFILGDGAAATVGETDVTIPLGQLALPIETVDLFAANRFASAATGAHHIWFGDLNGATATDDVMVVDGTVVAQQGAALPGGLFGGIAVTGFTADAGSQQMSPSGTHWLFRCAMADGAGSTSTDLVIHNGAIAAATDRSITPGSTELWDDAVFAGTFFVNTANSAGDTVIGGTTNNTDANLDAVLVYKPAGLPAMVLARESDPVDLDGNGAFDDNAFIDIFGNDDGVLSTDGYYYFIAAIQNGAGTSTGNAFLAVKVPCYADCEGDGDLDVFDFLCFQSEFATSSGYADCEGDGDWDVFDFLCFQSAFAMGCP